MNNIGFKAALAQRLAGLLGSANGRNATKPWQGLRTRWPSNGRKLVWEGKYDSAGNRVAPLRVALPFQTVETVNESTADRRHTLELFGQHRPTEWRNRLIWGDKKYVLPSLLAEFAGQSEPDLH